MKDLISEFFSACWALIQLPFHLWAIFFRRIHRLGWRKLTMLSIAGTFLLIATMFIFLKATSKPGFCGSCHLMRPYIEAWKESSHRDVDCMMCHAREGLDGYLETKFTALSMIANYFTGIYRRSKPWAEIEDANCLQEGCHETRLLDGKIEFTKGVIFDHTPHLQDSRRGRKLRCTSCHSQIVQGEHISVTSSTCYLCHFKNVHLEDRAELAACDKCHTPPTGEAALESGIYDHQLVLNNKIECQSCHKMMWQGTGEVRRERCGNCHSEAAHIDRIDDLEFIHEWHIEKRKVECRACHTEIEHRRPLLSTVVHENCSECHENEHEATLELYSGTGSSLLDTAPSYLMYSSGVTCLSCHKSGSSKQPGAHMNRGTCTPCHDEAYSRLVKDWRTGFNSKIAELEKALTKAGPHDELEHARQDLAFLKRGGAWHNPHFSDTLLTVISNVLSQSGAKTAPPTDIPDDSKICLECHTSIAEIPVKVAGSEFNHRTHLAYRHIACTQCHLKSRPENPRHGSRIKSNGDCSKCHHSVMAKKTENCRPCHKASRSLYFGDLPDRAKEPSPMAEADMVCTDCHLRPDFQPPKNKFCADCHDEDVIRGYEFAKGELLIALKSTKNGSEAARIVKSDKGRAVHHPDLAKKILAESEK